ncbi:MAG: hypothetical protein RL308_338 [Bacteroidota bacterium]|jgi:hypothetical protein
MSFLPRIGYPISDFEKFNYRLCSSIVGHIHELRYTNSIESFNNQLEMRPEIFKKSYLEKEINFYLDEIEMFSFPGASYFKEGYYEAIKLSLDKKKPIHFSHKPIDELIHNYLKPLKWNLNFSKEDIETANSLEDPSEFDNFLMNGTDLLERHTAIEEMGTILFYCDHLYELKKLLEKLEENELSQIDFIIGKDQIKISNMQSKTIKFSEKHIGADKELINELLEFLRDNSIIEKESRNNQRYYFNLLKGIPKESYPKIKWLKDIGLYKSFVKNVLFGQGRYQIAAEIFEVPGYSVTSLIDLNSKHKKTSESKLEVKMLKKGLQK